MSWFTRLFNRQKAEFRPAMIPLSRSPSHDDPVASTPEALPDARTMLGKLAKPSCGKCMGRGYRGVMLDGRPVACRCALNNAKEIAANAERVRQINSNRQRAGMSALPAKG